MKITVLVAVFDPEPLTSALLARDLVFELVRKGHEVTVFAPFPNRPSGKIMDGYKRKFREVRKRDGFRVVHSWHTISNESTMLSRFLENLSFGVSSTIQLLFQDKPDVVFMNTWPIFAQGLNSLVLKMRGIPLVCNVQDIYPEALVSAGSIAPTSFLARILLFLDTLHMKRCKKLVTISPGMKDLLVRTRKMEEQKVLFLPNWFDETDYVQTQEYKETFRKRHGIPEDIFLAMFAGSLVQAAGLQLYIDTAEKLRDREDILITLVGDGSMREELEHQIETRNLKNIRIIFPLKQNEVAWVQESADIMLLSLIGAVSDCAAPSKQISYMMSGKPIAANLNLESFPAKIINDADAGVTLPAQDPESLSSLLIKMADGKCNLTEKGINSKEYALENFSRRKVLPRLLKILENAVNP